MVRDGIAEKRPCPICWKGVLYNTGIKQKRAPHHFFYQCSFCGKTMTALKYERIMEHMKHPGVPMRKARKAVGYGRGGGSSVKAEKPKAMVPHPGFVVGVVRDAKTGKPIDMAHVCIRGRGVEAFTNRFGQYALEPVPEHREVEIEISSPGHAKKVHFYRYGIKGSEIRRLDVSLQPTRQVQRPASLKKTAPILEYRRGREVREVSSSGVSGIVKDIQGKPIFAALVTIFHHERILIVQTDTMGHYELMNILPPGDYMVRAAAYGYSFDRRWVRIEKGRAVRCDFVLRERKTTRG